MSVYLIEEKTTTKPLTLNNNIHLCTGKYMNRSMFNSRKRTNHLFNNDKQV